MVSRICLHVVVWRAGTCGDSEMGAPYAQVIKGRRISGMHCVEPGDSYLHGSQPIFYGPDRVHGRD